MIHLDRLISSFNPSVVTAFNDPDTTWTLPFSVPVDGSEGVLVVVSGDDALAPVGTIIPCTRTAPTEVTVEDQNIGIFEVFIGVQYTARIELSTLYPRKDLGRGQSVPDTRGHLQLRNIELEYQETGALDVTVTQPGRTPVVYSFESDVVEEGSIRVPLYGNNELLTIEVSSDSPLGARIVGGQWEGHHHVRYYPR